MLRFNKISQKPHLLPQFTGLTLEEFSALTSKLKPIWDQSEKDRLSQRERKHALGQGRKYKLGALEDKLLFILVFYRFHPTDELLGYIFDLHASNACRMRTKIEPLVEKLIEPSLRQSINHGIPPEIKKISTWEELIMVCPDFAEFIPNKQKPKFTEKYSV